MKTSGPHLRRRVILVLGMHRGGTSAITRALNASGVPLGDNLLPAGPDNPTGFWEDQDCLAVNEGFLTHFHSAYDRLGLARSFASSDPALGSLKIKAIQIVQQRLSEHGGIWGFKDPRTCRAIPFWREVIESSEAEVSFLIALRNPVSVALSLSKRNGIPAEKSYWLWLQHIVPAVLDTSGTKRVVVDYDCLLADPRKQLIRISSGLGLPRLDPSACDEFIVNFLDSGLRHEFSVMDFRVDSRVPEDLVSAYRLLSRAASDELQLEAPEIVENFNGFDSRLCAFSSAFDFANLLEKERLDLFRGIGNRDDRINELNADLAEREAQLAALRQTLTNRDQENTALCASLAERDGNITLFQGLLARKEAQVLSLQPELLKHQRTIASMKAALSEKDDENAALNRTLSAREEQITALQSRITNQEAKITEAASALADLSTRNLNLNHGLSERNAQIAQIERLLENSKAASNSLTQRVSELYHEVGELQRMRAEQGALVSSLRQRMSDADRQVFHTAQRLAERDQQIESLKHAVFSKDQQIASSHHRAAHLEAQLKDSQAVNADLRSSWSWRITAPLRSFYGATLKMTGHHRPAPSPATNKVEPSSGPVVQSRHPPVAPALAIRSPQVNDYVEDAPPLSVFRPTVRAVAFYLPQFHPIPENDEWWGKGFTEWSNVARATPQFKGHYQPHLPGELGFYDLRIKDVQSRQVELAKRYGIGAFCFYFYWFNGQRLLEMPLRQYLESAELDLPFCLCWANENWTRRWDGLDSEVLIAQKHSAEDDIAFIAHAARYMRDRRYLRVNGRPVLLVYRPSLLPDIRATVRRWREWAKDNGFPDLYLVYPQAFDSCDPSEFSFDAATEFPPNLSDPPVMTDQVELTADRFSGIVYDWRVLAERSRRYAKPGYKLLRGVCPSWDSEPRRTGAGTVFINSSPDLYREWVENAVNDTERRLIGDERLIFINAWNEWAEGAHLEPDRRYGYAWLRATREGLLRSRDSETPVLARVAVVTHDAYPHGAQFIALSIVRELTSSLNCHVEIICLGDGPLKGDFASYGKLHEFSGIDPRGSRARELARDLYQRGFRHALVNSTVSGLFLETLNKAGLNCVALVHEMSDLIQDYKLDAAIESVAKFAHSVVFPADVVRDSFCRFKSLKEEQVFVRPQGLLKHNPLLKEDRTVMRATLRQELGISGSARIVLGVGFADRRKGVDYFLEIAQVVTQQDSQAHLLWIGGIDPKMQEHISITLKRCPKLSDKVHFLGYKTDTSLYYAGADVFALTSREDPFPCVVLEAMDAGLPVIAFDDSGGSNRLIDQGLGQNVRKGDCPAFAAAILNMLKDVRLREEIAFRARALLSERFSFRRYVFELLTIARIEFPKISVVIPNYNYARYLPNRIATILSQSVPIYEIIFLDDASKDNSVALGRRLLADGGIDHKIICNDRNSGSVALQWKRGVELARGDYVWIAEADDESDPGFLATVLQGFRDPGVVLSYCESQQIDEEGRLLAWNYRDYVADLSSTRWTLPYVNDGVEEIRRYLAVKNTIPNVSAALIRRAELACVLDEQLDDLRAHRVAGDWKTYLHLLPSARLAFYPQPLNRHRRHRVGVSTGSSDTAHFEEIQRIQNWVARNYAVSSEVRKLGVAYLQVLREQFGLAD